MPLVNRSWNRAGVSLRVRSVLGMSVFLGGRSESRSRGILARSSGRSGASWSFSSSLACRARSLSSLAERAAAALSRRLRSAASRRSARPWSGSRITRARWGLSRKWRRMRPSNTGSPWARRALRSESGFSKGTRARGSPSWSQEVRATNMSDRPRGKDPVLFSRRSNSTELSAASRSPAGTPSLAMDSRVASTRSAAWSAVPRAMPLRPTEKYICLRSVSRPAPAMSSPRPESVRALRRGDEGRPMRMCSSTSMARDRSGSAASGRQKFRVNMDFWSPGPAA